ncbi:MAG: four helix bundle protein [Pirellulales bacterium]
MAFSFENLLVYRRSVDFADEVCSIIGQFARGYSFLVEQLNRARLSIAANIAEGNGRFTKADRKNFFGIARGSVQECVPLLEVARRQITSGKLRTFWCRRTSPLLVRKKYVTNPFSNHTRDWLWTIQQIQSPPGCVTSAARNGAPEDTWTCPT